MAQDASKWDGRCPRCGSRQVMYLRRSGNHWCRRCGWEGRLVVGETEAEAQENTAAPSRG